MNNNRRPKELDELFTEIGRYRKKEEFKELLEFIQRFPHIGPFNATLLHIQKPGARYVLTAPQWRRDFKRRIIPGARPLVLLQPFGPVRFVFDIIDTEGDEPLHEKLIHPFKANGFISNNMLNKLIENLYRSGISYHEQDYSPGMGGSISHAAKSAKANIDNKEIKINYDMVININMDTATKFSAIAHELGHLFCGHLTVTLEDIRASDDEKKKCKNKEEFEAETVSYIVCSRLGVATPADYYLSGYINDDGLLPDINYDRVLRSAGRVETMIYEDIDIPKDLVLKDFNAE